MPPEDAVRLQHMIDAAQECMVFTIGRTRTDLDTDRQLAFALARAIEIFGEAASKTSAETRRAIPGVAWLLAVGMRNRLAHAYFDVNLNVLWRTATEEIPAVLPFLRAAIAQDRSQAT